MTADKGLGEGCGKFPPSPPHTSFHSLYLPVDNTSIIYNMNERSFGGEGGVPFHCPRRVPCLHHFFSHCVNFNFLPTFPSTRGRNRFTWVRKRCCARCEKQNGGHTCRGAMGGPARVSTQRRGRRPSGKVGRSENFSIYGTKKGQNELDEFIKLLPLDNR